MTRATAQASPRARCHARIGPARGFIFPKILRGFGGSAPENFPEMAARTAARHDRPGAGDRA